MPYFTRLERYLDIQYERLKTYLFYHWKNLTKATIIFFVGFFWASGLATLIGQTGDWDVLISAIIIYLNELISKWVYGLEGKATQSFPVLRKKYLPTSINFPIKNQINQFKLGLLYGLFIDAFKLGS